MFEKLVSVLMGSRDQAHIFHWQTKGPGAYASHMALATYYEAIPDMLDALVESYQGKYGISDGYTSPDTFSSYDKSTAIKYFKGLSVYLEKAYDKFPKEDTNIINQLDAFKDLIYVTIYKLENLQ